MNNLHVIDRYVRFALAIVSAELAYFWLAGPSQWLAWGLAILLLVTATVRFCPVYRLLGLSFGERATNPQGRRWRWLVPALLASLLVGGSLASAAASRKLFLEEFNAMNHFYKETLFLTGKNERQPAVANFEKLMPALEAFSRKYTAYQPYALKGDAQLGADLKSVLAMVASVEAGVRTGDLHQAHLDLEKVRPVFQDLFKRNGFSMLSVALVDFHDAMELMLDAANASDVNLMAKVYPGVSDKLKSLELQANDVEIQAIRNNLDALMALAQNNKVDALSAQANLLKSSFVKVYLKRG